MTGNHSGEEARNTTPGLFFVLGVDILADLQYLPIMENNTPKVCDKVLIDDFVYGVVKEPEKPLKAGYVLVHIPHQENASISGGRFLIEIKRLKVNNALSFMRSPSGLGRYYQRKDVL